MSKGKTVKSEKTKSEAPRRKGGRPPGTGVSGIDRVTVCLRRIRGAMTASDKSMPKWLLGSAGSFRDNLELIRAALSEISGQVAFCESAVAKLKGDGWVPPSNSKSLAFVAGAEVSLIDSENYPVSESEVLTVVGDGPAKNMVWVETEGGSRLLAAKSNLSPA